MPNVGRYTEIKDGSPVDPRREAHLLRIAVAYDGPPTGLTAESLRPIVLDALAPQLETLTFVFGRNYWAEWTVDIQPRDIWQAARIAGKGAVPILGSRATAAVVLPPMFELGSNREGRMDGHANPEGPFRRAFEGHVHVCIRFLGGLITGVLGNAFRGRANRRAVEILAPRLIDVAEFYSLPSYGMTLKNREARTRRVIDRIVDDLPLPALERYKLGSKRKLGQIFHQRGVQRAAESGYRKVAEIDADVDQLVHMQGKPELKHLIGMLDILARAFVQARRTHVGQRTVRTEAETQPPADIAAALSAQPYDADGLDMMTAGTRDEEFSWLESIVLARNHDLDVSRIDLHQAWRRPVIAAWRAIGNVEYLTQLIRPDEADFVLAYHHLIGMESVDYKVKAAGAGIPDFIDVSAQQAIWTLKAQCLDRLPTYHDPGIAEPAW